MPAEHSPPEVKGTHERGTALHRFVKIQKRNIVRRPRSVLAEQVLEVRCIEERQVGRALLMAARARLPLPQPTTPGASLSQRR